MGSYGADSKLYIHDRQKCLLCHCFPLLKGHMHSVKLLCLSLMHVFIVRSSQLSNIQLDTDALC